MVMSRATYADWRGAVLDGRTTPRMADWVPEEQKRRLECADVLGRYFAGASLECLKDVAASHRENWTDTALVHRLADALAGLVLLGWRLKDDDEERAEHVNAWLVRSRIVAALRQAERISAALGDAVLVVRWDERKKHPIVETYFPSMYMPVGDTSAVIYWTRPEALYRDKIYVEHYIVGSQGDLVEPDRVRLTDTRMAGVKRGWVDTVERTSAGNPVALWDRLGAGVFEALHIDSLPVIHLPNGDTDMDGWGTSDFWSVLGLVDVYNELMADRRKGSKFLQPPIATWGDKPPIDKNGEPVINYAPNALYYVGQAGGMQVPDFSNMLKATHEEQEAVLADILQSIGLCKAMMGDVGEVSNRRDREVRLMYMPGVNKINARREERTPAWEKVLGLIRDVWLAHDKTGYTDMIGDRDITEMTMAMDPVLPEDVGEYVSQLTMVKNTGGIDRETYAKEALGAMGVSGDAAEIAKKAQGEEAAGLGLNTWPTTAGGE